jgi:hypothetical protein
MARQWRKADLNNHYYFNESDGKVVGHAFNYAHSMLWGAKVPSPLDSTGEMILGRYIEMEFAKKAIEEFWHDENRTLRIENEHFLSKS